ncbi:UNVERIFIED_CONTAM: Retrovirus-related Pol polyprotein from transposon RE2 [Sesamum radiatum]|uniref:Retrovirus-related Pol polyprotein from transposon RE2 n=1 Tax=Sesamum radiatum TaxID=300843 RepID=A0AAW2QHV6_SESRA
MFLIYGGGELILEGYSEASFQSDDDDAKSQSGFVFKLNSGVVAWKSSKQETTAIPPRKPNTPQLRKLPRRRFRLKTKEPRSHHRSKYIVRRYHLLREMVSRGDCRMDQVSSAENTADPLTKPMSQVAHTQHLDKMGLRSMAD